LGIKRIPTFLLAGVALLMLMVPLSLLIGSWDDPEYWVFGGALLYVFLIPIVQYLKGEVMHAGYTGRLVPGSDDRIRLATFIAYNIIIIILLFVYYSVGTRE
jgi:hypothetical protein